MIRGLWGPFYLWHFQGHPDFEDPVYYKAMADFGDVVHIFTGASENCGVGGGYIIYIYIYIEGCRGVSGVLFGYLGVRNSPIVLGSHA